MTKAEKTKQLILEAAAPIFNRKGIAGTTVDDVLDAAGVARGSLYSYFANKDQLAFGVSEYLIAKTNDAIAAACKREKTAAGKVHAYLGFYKNPLNTHTEGGCPIFNLAVEADNNNAVVKEMVKKAIISAQQLLITILQDGIRSGELSPELDAQAFSFRLFAAVEGGIIICRVMDSNKPMQTLIREFRLELAKFQLV